MAWRPDKNIIRGEIDNTVRGRVTGTLWLLGRDEPVTLDLSGDAWADVAGCKVAFTNPDPKNDGSAHVMAAQQTGRVGDITASNKRKVFTVPEAEWSRALNEGRLDEVPFTIKNVLYLEWYSTANGRVVVENPHFEVTVSEPFWAADADDDAAQQMLNMDAMREFLDKLIARRNPADAKWPDEMTEDEWEQSLRDNERLTDAAMEAEEKFRDDPDADTKEAYVMGWDHLNAALKPHASDGPLKEWMMDEDGDADASDGPEAPASPEDEAEADDDDDEALDFERHQHPLARQAQEYVIHFMSRMEDLHLTEAEYDRGTPYNRFDASVLQISGKLAGALNWSGAHRQPDGYILAITRRCLNWANEALAALTELEAAPPGGATSDFFTSLRPGLFAIRDGITELRREMGEP